MNSLSTSAVHSTATYAQKYLAKNSVLRLRLRMRAVGSLNLTAVLGRGHRLALAPAHALQSAVLAVFRVLQSMSGTCKSLRAAAAMASCAACMHAAAAAAHA
jgi:hypothetical protein